MLTGTGVGGLALARALRVFAALVLRREVIFRLKYLLAGLLLGTAIFPTRATDAPPPLPATNGSAGFATSDLAGTTIEVGIDAQDSFTPTQVSIFITRDRHVCTEDGCHHVPVIDAYTVQAVAPRDAFIDRHVRGGFLPGTFHLRDGVTNADLVVRVDAEWTAAGPTVCAQLDKGASCVRTATVLADVESGDDRFVANWTIPDGQLIWREPAY